ncbi:hypothetical protein L6Q96_02930 [Candidatus Binatia bacterium]|nr:hypothetical protein [Candidatus Binatia bacterium]
MRAPLVELFAALKETFDRLHMRWYVFGAQAAILYGSPRLTADVDITVDIAERPTAALIDALARSGFHPRVDTPIEFVERTRVLPLEHVASGIAVDVVLAGPGLEEVFFERRREVSIEDVGVPVASAEDIVIMKVLAGRAKDLDDVVAIVTANRRHLDTAHIRQTLHMLEEALDRRDLLAAFERALTQCARQPR